MSDIEASLRANLNKRDKRLHYTTMGLATPPGLHMSGDLGEGMAMGAGMAGNLTDVAAPSPIS